MEFEQIYTTYFKPVYQYMCGLTGDEHIAEEITSETFLFEKEWQDRIC